MELLAAFAIRVLVEKPLEYVAPSYAERFIRSLSFLGVVGSIVGGGLVVVFGRLRMPVLD